jgi:hypothetical protein
MENPGERLVGDYLRHIKGCDFINFNVYTPAEQGEIDVVGVAHVKKQAYICEVVTHLTTGIQYVKNKRPDTSDRLIKKFLKNVHYGTQTFPDYIVSYMLWSPVVRRSSGKPEYDQFRHLRRVEGEIRAQTGVGINLVINNDYLNAIGELRAFAGTETKELKSPVMRFLQIEEWTRKNARKIALLDTATQADILEIAGKWRGDFERPDQGEYEKREPL